MDLQGDTKYVPLDQSSSVRKNKTCVTTQPEGQSGALSFQTVTWQGHSGPLGRCRSLSKHCQGVGHATEGKDESTAGPGKMRPICSERVVA